jgi:hypothetical protein
MLDGADFFPSQLTFAFVLLRHPFSINSLYTCYGFHITITFLAQPS